MTTDNRSKKDVWDKLDILAKGILVLVISGGIGFYTTVVQEEKRILQEENRLALSKEQLFSNEAETLIRIFNQREISDTSLRSNMFEVLLQHFFSKDDPESQIVALQMIGLNFRDALQIRPMFYYIDRQIDKIAEDEAERMVLKEMLAKAARTIIRDQLLQIDNASEGKVCELILKNSPDAPPDVAECFRGRAFKLVSVNYDAVEIQPYELKHIPSEDEQAEFINNFEPVGDSFNVSYFDMPMVDYTRLPNSSIHYSLVLLKVEGDTAKLSLAILPSTEFSSRDAFKFDERVKDLYTDRRADIEAAK